MGSFDTVIVRCPKCGHGNKEQSKSGKCNFDTYTNPPADVACGIHGNISDCKECGAMYHVDVQVMVRTFLGHPADYEHTDFY